jgi:hypothetical protein
LFCIISKNIQEVNMKKLIAILLAAAFIPAMVFAGPFDIVIGSNLATAQTSSEMAQKFDIGQISLGPEVRVKLLFLEAGAKANFAFHPEVSYFHGAGNLDLTAEIDLGALRVGAGIQTDDIIFAYDDGTWTSPRFWNTGKEDFIEGFLASHVNWRVKADLIIDNLLLGADYTIPTEYIYGAENQDSALLLPKDWGKGKLSLSFMYSFF